MEACNGQDEHRPGKTQTAPSTKPEWCHGLAGVATTLLPLDRSPVNDLTEAVQAG